MPTNTLNDAQCRAAKPSEKARKLFDGGGLHLFVSPTGSKTWRLAYRYHGKPKNLSFGPYPEVSLAQARSKRDAAKAALRDGIDPMVVKRPSAQKNITLAAANETYWGGRKDVSDGYRNNARRGIEMHLNPTLGKLPVREIDRERLLAALNVMNATGRYVYVRKVRMWVGQVFEWAIEQGYAQDNPCLTIDPRKAFGKSRVRHFSALEQRDMPEFLARIAMEKELNSVLAWLSQLAVSRTSLGSHLSITTPSTDCWRGFSRPRHPSATRPLKGQHPDTGFHSFCFYPSALQVAAQSLVRIGQGAVFIDHRLLKSNPPMAGYCRLTY